MSGDLCTVDKDPRGSAATTKLMDCQQTRKVHLLQYRKPFDMPSCTFTDVLNQQGVLMDYSSKKQQGQIRPNDIQAYTKI